MKPMHRFVVSLLTSVLLAPALLLGGCGGNVSFPDTVVPTAAQKTPVGAIKGSAYGGHAPIIGSHVYVLEPQSTGYGNQAKSLISSNASGATVNASDPGLPTTAYYVTTDSTGSFNLTGDYTCDAGYPVYLYSYGGTPQFGSSQTVSISNVTITGSGSPYTYTFTTTAPEFAYTGELVTFTPTGYGPFFGGGNTYNIVSTPSTTSFTLQSSSNISASSTGLMATFLPTPNPGIVELAVLGICPTSGSIATGGPIFNGTTSSALNFVYMNEVSTVAAAYVFAPFSANAAVGSSFSSTTNNATYIGTSSTNLVGLQNAALNAGQLYSVNGTGPTSTTYAGEGHIANATTPNGNGYVSQATIDTVANILAACVDSYSTNTTVGGSNISTQCNTLFQYATQSGIPTSDTNPGTQPYDTATAAINIALNPGGPPPSDTTTTYSAWVSKLYSLPTGAVPFTPNLTTQPNDFTVGILYPESLNSTYFNGLVQGHPAVDQIGDVWFASGSGSSGYVFQMSPLGAIGNTTAGTVYNYTSAIPEPPVVDAYGNVWFAGSTTGGPLLELKVKSSGNPYTYGTTASQVSLNKLLSTEGETPYFGDSSGNMYALEQIQSNGQITGYHYMAYIPYGYTSEYDDGLTVFEDTNYPPLYSAVDGNGAVWLDQYNPDTSSGYVSRVELTTPSTGASPSSGTWPVTKASTGCGHVTFASFGIGIVRSQNAVVASLSSNSVLYISASTGDCTEYTNSSLGISSNGMFYPRDAVVDGRDYVYVLNFFPTSNTPDVGSITVLNESSGTGLTAKNYTWSPLYYPPGTRTITGLFYYPSNMALDPSGNIWTVNAPSSVVEVIGAAAPTTTPLARATCTSTTACIGYAP